MFSHRHPINTAGAGSESQEQQKLFRWWEFASSRWPDAVMFAVPNGGWRTPATARRLKAEGVLAGVPDVFLAAPRGSSHGMFIEMKRTHGGTASKAQRLVMARLMAAGYSCSVCHGFESARRTVEGYLDER